MPYFYNARGRIVNVLDADVPEFLRQNPQGMAFTKDGKHAQTLSGREVPPAEVKKFLAAELAAGQEIIGNDARSIDPTTQAIIDRAVAVSVSQPSKEKAPE